MTGGVLPWAESGPLFRCAERTGRDPVALHGGRPLRISAAKLALFLSPVAVMRDALPETPWADISRVQPTRPGRPDRPADPAELRDRFQAAVERQCGGAHTVAVSLSGGMDSLAVLTALARGPAARERRLVAVVSDIPSDDGMSPAVAARQQIAALGLDCPVLAVPEDLSAQAEPAWSPWGPRFFSVPQEHRALADTAQEAGAEVLLTGAGADQLLRSPAGQFPGLLASGRLRDATRYVTDARDGERGLLTELLAVRGLRSARHVALFMALCVLPRYRRCAGPDLLADRYRAQAGQWFSGFVQAQADHHRRQGWSLPRALLFELVYPHEMPAAAAELPERSPFWDRQFADWAWQLPPACRYGQAPRSGYLRDKHLVGTLIPPALGPLLPRRSMRSVLSLGRYWARRARTPRLLTEFGILRGDWQARASSLYDLQMVNACEDWLLGAVERGAQVTA